MFTKQENRALGNRLVPTPSGLHATWSFVLHSHYQLRRAALYIRRNYFHASYGWDTHEAWLAYMLLLVNAALLIGDPEIHTVEAGYVVQNPEDDLSWFPSIGRAAQVNYEENITLLRRAAAIGGTTWQIEYGALPLSA